MEQTKKNVLQRLLSTEGIKSNSADFQNLFKYYGYTIDNESVYGGRARKFLLPDELVSSAKKFGIWSIYLGNPDGFSRHELIRNLLKAEHFREYVDYPELLNKIYRAKFVTQMLAEMKETQYEIEGLNR